MMALCMAMLVFAASCGNKKAETTAEPAKVEVEVKSNKNSNKYLIKQIHKEKNDEQEVLEPETIKGVKIIYKDSSLTVENSNLNLEKIYNNYPYIESNIF